MTDLIMCTVYTTCVPASWSFILGLCFIILVIKSFICITVTASDARVAAVVLLLEEKKEREFSRS